MCIMCRCRGSGERRVEIKFVLIFVLSLDTVSLCAWPMGKGEGCEGAWSSRFCGNEPSREKNPYLTPHQNNDSLCLKIIQKSCQVSANHRLFIQFGENDFCFRKNSQNVYLLCHQPIFTAYFNSLHHFAFNHSESGDSDLSTSRNQTTGDFQNWNQKPWRFQKTQRFAKKKKLKIFLKTCCHSLLMEWLLCHHLYIHSGWVQTVMSLFG